MVTDRPSREWALGGAGMGVAPGGASAEVGAVCQTVADHLAACRSLLASVWVERGGRLRCMAGTGEWPARDGISPTAGVVGATFTSGVETVVADAAPPGAAAGAVAHACLPIH